METLSFIQWCLDNLNYWTVTLLMAIESSFIPFPSEVVVAPAGYKAATGELNIYLIILFATCGACIGALINYGLSLWLGRPLIYKFADSKFGRMLLLNSKKIEKSEAYFRKHGIVSTLVGRLIPAIRQLISIPAGLSKMDLRLFLLFTAIGASLWNTFLAILGYSLEAVVPKDQLLDTVYKYSHEIGRCFIGAGIVLVLYLIYQSYRKKKKNKSNSL